MKEHLAADKQATLDNGRGGRDPSKPGSKDGNRQVLTFVTASSIAAHLRALVDKLLGRLQRHLLCDT